MIEVKDVNLTIKKHEILKGITCSFDYGTITGLVGNNGCGKTMLMKCICGFIRPSSGQVLFDGKRIGKDTDYLRHAGIIIETPRFIDYYSGMKNLKVLCGLSGKPDVAKLKETLDVRAGSGASDIGSKIQSGNAAATRARAGDYGRSEGADPGRAF